MDIFIRNDFRMSVENHYCAAYVVTYQDEVVAVFALSFDSLDLDSDGILKSERFTDFSVVPSRGYSLLVRKPDFRPNCVNSPKSVTSYNFFS